MVKTPKDTKDKVQEAIDQALPKSTTSSEVEKNFDKEVPKIDTSKRPFIHVGATVGTDGVSGMIPAEGMCEYCGIRAKLCPHYGSVDKVVAQVNEQKNARKSSSVKRQNSEANAGSQITGAIAFEE